MALELIDPDDGENRAVRSFLLLYGGACGVTVAQMRDHMRRSGYPLWPDWVEPQGSTHLTKLGAQNWLRHLFALEGSPDVLEPHSFKEWTGGGPVRPYCGNCGRLRNDPLHAAGVPEAPADELRQQAEKVCGYLGNAFDGEPRRVILALLERTVGVQNTDGAQR